MLHQYIKSKGESYENKTGMQAPDFTLPCHLGKDVTLGILRGKTVVLVFLLLACTSV